jgi:hypothetical protein
VTLTNLTILVVAFFDHPFCTDPIQNDTINWRFYGADTGVARRTGILKPRFWRSANHDHNNNTLPTYSGFGLLGTARHLEFLKEESLN